MIRTRFGVLSINWEGTPKGTCGPLEVSHDHLLIVPPSHFTPQKVEKVLLLVDSLRVEKIVEMISLLKGLSRIIWELSFTN